MRVAEALLTEEGGRGKNVGGQRFEIEEGEFEGGEKAEEREEEAVSMALETEEIM